MWSLVDAYRDFGFYSEQNREILKKKYIYIKTSLEI